MLSAFLLQDDRPVKHIQDGGSGAQIIQQKAGSQQPSKIVEQGSYCSLALTTPAIKDKRQQLTTNNLDEAKVIQYGLLRDHTRTQLYNKWREREKGQ